MWKFLTMCALVSMPMIGSTAPVLHTDQSMISLSAVKNVVSQDRPILIRNTGSKPVAMVATLSGTDAAAFKVTGPTASLAPGATGRLVVAFRPTRGAGVYQADLTIGGETGSVVRLRGIGLAAFEGRNEPTLDQIVQTLGIPVDVGGVQLGLDTTARTIGDSVAAGYFRGTGPEMVKVTAIARFSPPGETPVGIFRQGGEELKELGRMGASTKSYPDAHQTLFPPLADGAKDWRFAAGDAPFGFFMAGHLYTSFTDSGRISKGKLVKHAARIYPVKSFQGKMRKNAWLVGFEEAKNGDFQDLLLLVENVIVVPGSE